MLRVEQYFELDDFNEEEKLRAVRMCFTGDALLWYRWERDRNPFTDWELLKFRVLEQYSGERDVSAGEKLLKIQQERTVREYCRDFIALATNAVGIADNVLEMAFMNGLKSKIRAGVRLNLMYETKTLRKMMDTAKLVEDWENEDSPVSSPTKGETSPKPIVGKETSPKPLLGRQAYTKPNNVKPGPTQKDQTTPVRSQPNRPQGNHNRLRPPFRKLTPEEVAKWKAEGLCYKCDEKYVSPHICSRKELTVLLVQEDGCEEELVEEVLERTNGEETEVAELSANSVVGMSSPRTLKLRGRIGDETVVVLIDSGATHNFISLSLMKKMKLQSKDTGRYGVLVAGGVKVAGRGIVEGVTLQLEGCTVEMSYLPLELGIADVILGVQWLNTLGETRFNWKL